MSQAPTMPQLLLRQLGRDLYEAGRPLSACLTKDERIGWQEAEAEASRKDNVK